MNPDHKGVINSNFRALVDKTDVDTLLPKLVEKGVFTDNMVLKYKGIDNNLKRDLYLTILTRGPNAFNSLVSALRETEQYGLASLLNPEINVTKSVHQRRTQLSQLASHATEDTDVNLSTDTLQIKVRNSSKAMDSSSEYKTIIYQMTSKPKGFAMIINIKKYNDDIEEERHGAEHDERNLKVLFQQLGYVVIIHQDLNGKDMMDTLRSFAQSNDHSYVDSCILAILCHGEQIGGENYFVAADGVRVGVNSVLALFTNEKCQHLAKKPKIFIFQCCRGDRRLHGISKDTRTRTDGAADTPLRTYSDMLIAYATVKGSKSHRDLHLGSWFVQAICEIFMNHACDTEIMEMLKMVDCWLENLVSEKNTMQTTCFENRGFKTFFFNPGVYDDDG